MRAMHRARYALPALLLLAATPAAADGDVDGFRAKLEKWVETQRILSKEVSDWTAERETLEASRGLLRQEKQALTEEIAELEASGTQADEERSELLQKRAEYQSADVGLEARIREMEQRVKALAPRLPEPLRRKLELLLVQIPEDPEAAGAQLGQRLMNVLGVLAQAEKWNGTATIVGETRAVDGDEDQKVQVRTLYWGLAEAFYVDAKGRTAGIGTPGAEGWKFTNDPGLAGDAQRFLDMYEGNSDEIDFVELPVAID